MTKITNKQELIALPEDSVVKTNFGVRVKTHSSDEWNFVMTSEEILKEGKGSVTLMQE